MKMQQLEYIIAIARAGSITAAAKNLYQAQPNISIALKELESEVGMQIFWRTPNGMVLTPEGESFLARAKDIVDSMHSLEADYTNRADEGVSLKISVIHSAYIPEILGKWVNELTNEEKISVKFFETNTNKVIEDVTSGRADVGIIRAPHAQCEMYAEQLRNRKLEARPLLSFVLQPIMSVDHPLADKDDVTFEELEQFPEIVHDDGEMNLFENTYINSDYESKGSKKIYIRDSESKMLFLQTVKNSYMWGSGGSWQSFEGGRALKQVKCDKANIRIVDMMICKKSHESNRTIKACMDFFSEKCAELPCFDPV